MILKVLIVEDDFISRRVVNEFLKTYGVCDVAVNGKEAITAFQDAVKDGEYYDLVCLDIMMPEMNGQEVLKKMREIEKENGIHGLEGVKIIMATALSDSKSVMKSFRDQCEAYVVKPIKKRKLFEQMLALGLIDEKEAS